MKKNLKFYLSILIVIVVLGATFFLLDRYYSKKGQEPKKENLTEQSQSSADTKPAKEAVVGQRFSTSGKVLTIDSLSRELVLKLDQDDQILKLKKDDQAKFKVTDRANISDIQNNTVDFDKIKKDETLMLLGVVEKDKLSADVVLVGGLPKPPGNQ